MSYSLNGKKIADRILRDTDGSKIGTLKVENGRQVVINKHGSLAGVYDHDRDITTDGAGVHIGAGNLLLNLIKGSLA